jgi:hypothetical protein
MKPYSRVEVLEPEGCDMNKALLVLTDGHPFSYAVHMQRQGKKPRHYSNVIEPLKLPLHCAMPIEARAIVNGLRLARKQWNGKDPVIVANDNTELITYASLFFNKIYSKSVCREKMDSFRLAHGNEEISLLNNMLANARELNEEMPIYWAEMVGQKRKNIPHGMCRSAEERFEKKIDSYKRQL